VVADASVGVFLSGGLDSSVIAAIAAQAHGRDQLTSFTARFDAASYDEGEWASNWAREIGTRHINVPCGNAELLRAVRTVSSRVAEPVSDPAILPSFLLADAAREHVRVVLSGEGADELLGGYPTYLGHQVAGVFAALPAPVKRACVRLVNALPVSDRKVSIEFLLKRFVRGIDRAWPDRHLEWFGTGGGASLDATPATDWINVLLDGYRDFDALRGPMLFDYQTYLRDQLLVKMDRATMLNSIEGRAPFLDHSLSTFAFAMAPDLKLRHGVSKWILKAAAAAWLPRNRRSRRKRGLSVPIATLINGALREPTTQLLDPVRLQRHGLLDDGAVRRMLEEHRAGKGNHARALWSVIMLQLWLERWQPSLASDHPFGDIDFPRPMPKLVVEWPDSPRLVQVADTALES
jgi:asparagine synthase (glutamine-hydrolysing)